MNIKALYIKHCTLYKRWDDEEIYRWESRRVKGKLMHICVSGLGWYGCILFIGIMLATFHLAGQGDNSVSIDRLILTNIALCSLSGMIFGLVTWHATEYSYLQHKEDG